MKHSSDCCVYPRMRKVRGSGYVYKEVVNYGNSSKLRAATVAMDRYMNIKGPSVADVVHFFTQMRYARTYVYICTYAAMPLFPLVTVYLRTKPVKRTYTLHVCMSSMQIVLSAYRLCSVRTYLQHKHDFCTSLCKDVSQ